MVLADFMRMGTKISVTRRLGLSIASFGVLLSVICAAAGEDNFFKKRVLATVSADMEFVRDAVNTCAESPCQPRVAYVAREQAAVYVCRDDPVKYGPYDRADYLTFDPKGERLAVQGQA